MKSFCENLYKKRKIVSADVSRADVCPTDITKELIKVNGKKKKLGDINRQNNNDSEIASDRLFLGQADQKDDIPINVTSVSSESQALTKVKKSAMQIVEDHLLDKVFIRRLYNGVYLYNGKYYIPLSAQDYAILLRSESDDGIISLLKSYRQFEDGYKFLASNPKIEFEDYIQRSIQYRTFISFKNKILDAKTGKTYRHHPDHPIIFGVNTCYKKHPNDTPYWDYFPL